MRGDADVGRAYFQRQWDARAYGQYLRYLTAAEKGEDDADPYGSVLRPQVEAITRAVFRALEAAPSSLLESGAGRSRSKLKRFGLDLLVDEDFRVWLIGTCSSSRCVCCTSKASEDAAAQRSTC